MQESSSHCSEPGVVLIQGVESFEQHTRTDLDYTAEAGWYEHEGCEWDTERDLKHVSVDNWDGASQRGIAEQEKADGGQAWAFTDPQRVAIESLKLLYPGRFVVTRWRPAQRAWPRHLPSALLQCSGRFASPAGG